MMNAEMGNKELPLGWQWVQIGEILQPSPERIDPKANGIAYIGLEHIEKSTGKILGHGYSDDVKSLKSRFSEGDLLYGKLRPYLNKVWVAEFDGLCSTDILVFQDNKFILNKYLKYRFLQEDFVKYANQNASGVQHPRVDFKKLAKFRITIAPLPEQHHIVARIEELFSRLDAGMQALQRAKAQLQRYRQSVLEAAMTGRLTAEWREAHPEVEPAEELLEQITERQQETETIRNRYSEILESEPPKSWLLVKIADVGCVQLGRQRSPKHHSGEYMRPYLRVANVFENRIDTSDILMMNFTPEEFKRYQLHYGDILLNEGQSLELIGRPAIYRDELPGSCFQNTLIRFSPFKGVDAEYSLCVFRSYFHNGIFQRIAKLTTTMAHLGAGRFSNLLFPLPPLLEQKEIASKISQLESMAENTEIIIDHNLKKTDRLRQSILQHAFQGKLIPQDPSDEPASLLLERIRGERINEAPRRGRKSKAHQARLSQ